MNSLEERTESYGEERQRLYREQVTGRCARSRPDLPRRLVVAQGNENADGFRAAAREAPSGMVAC